MSQPRIVKLDLDSTAPIQFGEQVCSQLAMPVLAHAEHHYTHQQRAQMWAGFMAAATGAMVATLGAASVEAVLDAIRPAALDAARQVDASRAKPH
ncbi:MAG: hypothetical protein EOP38_20440 [Rubrivivax sp.]|nr:MAG: hypothetical protein EOP38_20440 [Rubrivivax sp.]